jgi:hypothetical protein
VPQGPHNAVGQNPGSPPHPEEAPLLWCHHPDQVECGAVTCPVPFPPASKAYICALLPLLQTCLCYLPLPSLALPFVPLSDGLFTGSYFLGTFFFFFFLGGIGVWTQDIVLT